MLETESGSSARVGGDLDGWPISLVPTSCLHCCLGIAGQSLSLSLYYTILHYLLAVILGVGEGNVRIRKWEEDVLIELGDAAEFGSHLVIQVIC